MNAKRALFYGTNGLLTFMLLGGGYSMLTGAPDMITNLARLGLTNTGIIALLGTLKVLAAIGLWVPAGREWAEKGLVFLFTGALAAHAGAGDPLSAFAPAGIALLLTIVSLNLRPRLQAAALTFSTERIAA
ncbi:MAG TPA: DoxX family protein [Bdellovibrionales bacterium]|nr:DoxX family protein [Bdellovibrionales bacterium]